MYKLILFTLILIHYKRVKLFFGYTNVDSSCGEFVVVILLISNVPLGMPGLTEPLTSRPPPIVMALPLPTLGVGGVAVAARTPYVGT